MDSAASPVVPRQMLGSAGGVPSLVSATQVSAAPVASDGWRAEVKGPKGSVAIEDRSKDAVTGSKTSSLPSGAQ